MSGVKLKVSVLQTCLFVVVVRYFQLIGKVNLKSKLYDRIQVIIFLLLFYDVTLTPAGPLNQGAKIKVTKGRPSALIEIYESGISVFPSTSAFAFATSEWQRM